MLYRNAVHAVKRRAQPVTLVAVVPINRLRCHVRNCRKLWRGNLRALIQIVCPLLHNRPALVQEVVARVRLHCLGHFHVREAQLGKLVVDPMVARLVLEAGPSSGWATPFAARPGVFPLPSHTVHRHAKASISIQIISHLSRSRALTQPIPTRYHAVGSTAWERRRL